MKLKLLPHTTVSTIDRLLLPELLRGVSKVLYLDVDLAIEDDLRQLYDIDLTDYRLAAKLSSFETWRTGVRLVTRASLHMPAEEAWNLRRLLHFDGSLAFPAVNAGVLLMNLDKMREEGLSQRFIPLVENCFFNDQDVLNVYGRNRILPIEPRWNFVPTQDYCEAPGIIHWAGTTKPWSRMYILEKERFERYRRSVAMRDADAGH
jgi:lipopolysaccharide biosynthesis glycosyltransferase